MKPRRYSIAAIALAGALSVGVSLLTPNAGAAQASTTRPPAIVVTVAPQQR